MGGIATQPRRYKGSEPPTAPTAGDTRLEGRPGDRPCCDDTGEPVGSRDNLPKPGPVATATSEGGAQETRARMCPATPPQRHTPVIPAK